MSYKILSKKPLGENLFELKIKAPHITKNGKAGQFIIVRPNPDSERIPLTIADIEGDDLTIVFMAVGVTTKELSLKNDNDELEDIVGPLGVATEAKNYGTVVCVAGGYGAAPCYLIAKALKEAGNRVHIILGARNEKLLFWLEKMKTACHELFITTDDGSMGQKGLVTDVLADIIEKEPVHHVLTIGPMPMMRACANMTRPHNIHTTASMNPIMVDGTGMCGACRVTVGGEVKFACIDGPDFDAHKIDFDEVINRMTIYKEHEQAHLQKHRDKGCNLMQ